MFNDTICAIATPPGIGATAMIRISGVDAFKIAECLLSDGFSIDDLPANMAKFTSLYDKNNTYHEIDKLVDQVVFTKFVAPHSFTGENVVEISCHGSIYIQKKIIELLIHFGCRLALPGEFTQRAFLNGKLDLPQAEAISDLINAQSESAHTIAMNQLQGTLSTKLNSLREELLSIASLIELELDFSEEDVEFADRQHLLSLLSNVEQEANFLLKGFKSGNLLKHGVPVAIVGEPNVGKSTLMNAILQRERAIVSDIPGTTRDTIEDFFYINGILFRFIDTAGIRNSSDKVERIGIERTFKTLSEAAILLYVFDSDDSEQVVLSNFNSLKLMTKLNTNSIILVANKSDKRSNSKEMLDEAIYISAKYGDNVDDLVKKIYSLVEKECISSNTSLVANERHYYHLNQIVETIENVRNNIDLNISADIVAEDIRSMLDNLGKITGTISSDDILNNIFGKFCIGK